MWAALGAAVVLVLSGCGSEDDKKASPKDPAAAKAEIKAKVDKRRQELAARPDIDPGVAAYMREVLDIGEEFGVRGSESNSTIDEAVIEIKANREEMCTSDGNGGWAPGFEVTSMRSTVVKELAKQIHKDKMVDGGESVETVVAGRIVTAIETKLCAGKQQGA
jgi:hypothetical protein